LNTWVARAIAEPPIWETKLQKTSEQTHARHSSPGFEV
jgi:hypothetical protein